jgi:prepilin-type N-terminal cleavage/methylation domain-containing protein
MNEKPNETVRPDFRAPACALRNAFTLIELLVVVVIVASLATMLLPILARAKKLSHMAKCLSNLHQIGIGMRLYVDDNVDTFPPAARSQINTTVLFNTPEDVYYGNFPGGKDLSAFGKFASDGTPVAPTNRVLNAYVAASETWHCPADRGIFGSQGTCFDTFGTCYRFNWRTITGTMVGRSIRSITWD